MKKPNDPELSRLLHELRIRVDCVSTINCVACSGKDCLKCNVNAMITAVDAMLRKIEAFFAEDKNETD